MSKNNFVFLISAVLSMFYSCGLPYCKKTHLNDDELAWISHININDTIFLYSENIVDTLVFTDKTIHNKYLISIFDLKACNWMEGQNEYNASASCDFNITHNGKTYDGGLMVIKYVRKTSSSVNILFDIGGLFTNDLMLDSSDTLLILTKNINAEESQAIESMGVKSVEWSKIMGIRSIELDDGTILVANKRRNKE